MQGIHCPDDNESFIGIDQRLHVLPEQAKRGICDDHITRTQNFHTFLRAEIAISFQRSSCSNFCIKVISTLIFHFI